MLELVNEFLERTSAIHTGAMSLATVLIIFWLDASLDPFYSLWVFYGVPLSVITWYCGRDEGLALAVLAGLLTVMATVWSGGRYPSSFAAGWALGTTTLAMFILVVLLAKIRSRLNIERQLARIDALTGSLNKRAFEEELKYLLALCRRESLPLSVAYIDLDNFKDINDKFGHHAGDLVLQAIAAILKEFTRRTDRVTRLGGDEFAVLLPDTDEEGAQFIINKARRAFAGAFPPDRALVTSSIGVVTFVTIPDDIQEALKAADQVMYEVKTTGKNGAMFKTVGRTAQHCSNA